MSRDRDGILRVTVATNARRIVDKKFLLQEGVATPPAIISTNEAHLAAALKELVSQKVDSIGSASLRQLNLLLLRRLVSSPQPVSRVNYSFRNMIRVDISCEV